MEEKLAGVGKVNGGEGRNAGEKQVGAEDGREDVDESQTNLGRVVAPWKKENARVISAIREINYYGDA